MTTNFFEHETIPQNSSVSPVESLAVEVSEAFDRLSTILNTTSVLPSLSSVIGSYLLLDVNYHGFEEEYTESFSIENSTKDIVLSTEPTDMISVSYLNVTTSTEVYLDLKLPQQEFTTKAQYKVIGKVLSLSGDLSAITLKVKYRGIRKEFGNLKLKPNVIKNSNNTYLLSVVKTDALTYKLTYDSNISINFEKIFGSQTIDPSKVYLLIKDGNDFKNISFTSVYVSGNDVIFTLNSELDNNYEGVVYISNTSMSEFFEAFYYEFINHSHDKTSSEGLINHANLIDLYKNTSTIFYKDLGVVNYDHPQYFNREGYNSSLTSVYENAILGDLFLAAKISEYDQEYKTLLKNSNSILFGDPVRGSKLYFDATKKALTLLSGNGLNGLYIEVGSSDKAIVINNNSYIKEDDESLKIHGKNGVVEVVPLNSSAIATFKSPNVEVDDKLTASSADVSELSIGNVLIAKEGNNIHASLKDPQVISKMTSSITTEYEDLQANHFNAATTLLGDGDVISTDNDTAHITKKESGLKIVSTGSTSIESSGRKTGLEIGKESAQSVNIYTSDYLGQQSSQIDTSVYIETPPNTDTYLLNSTDSEIVYGSNKYVFGDSKDGYTTIENLKEWRRSNLHGGNGNFYSFTLKASDGIKKNGLTIGTTKLSTIGLGLDCPAGMTLLESSDTVAIIKPLPEDQIECSDVSYQNLDAGNIQAFGTLNVDDSIYAVENITAGESLISKTLTTSDAATVKSLNVQSESLFSGESEFNGAVKVLNRMTVTGSTEIGGSLTSIDITTDNYASIGGTLTVQGQTILNNSVIVEGRISTTGGFTTTGSIQCDSLKTGPIESQNIHSVGGFVAEGAIQLTGPTTIDGNVLINGNGLLQGSFETTSELTSKSLYVMESTVIGGRLTVQGSTVLEGSSISLGTTGSTITISGTLQLDAPTTTMTGDVRIFKQLDIAQDLKVSGGITTSNTLTATNLQVSASASIDGLLKADSGEFNRKTYFVEGIKANGDSEFSRLRVAELNVTTGTVNQMSVIDSLTMGPDSTVKTENLITASFSQTSSSEDVLISGPTKFLSPVTSSSKFIIGNTAIESGRNTSGVLITDREITMGNNSIIKATKIFATKGLPIGSNQDKNAGFCFEAASNNGGTDGDTGFFATTGTGSGIDGSNLEFWIDGSRKGVISKEEVPFNASSSYNEHIVTIKMLKDALADMNAKIVQLNQATGDRFWPIGSIYTTMDNRNPYEIFGFGTWIKFAPGRTIVGSTSTDPMGQISGGLVAPAGMNLTVAGSVYGDFTHKLVKAEIPSHNHSEYPFNKFTGKALDTGRETIGSGDYNYTHSEYAVGSMREEHWTAATERTIGEDQPHNNVQPSIVVNIWQRLQ